MFRKFPSLFGLTLVRGQRVRHGFRRHTHRSWCFGIVDAGERRLRYGGQEYVLGPGAVMVIPPDRPHACASPAGHDYWMLCLPPDFLGPRTGVEIPKIADVGLYRSIHRFCRSLEHRNDSSRSVRELFALLERLASHLPKNGSALAPAAKNLAGLRRYIEAHCAEPLALSWLARRVRLSPFHLVRQFTAAFGLPPHAYQNQWRIRQAMDRMQRKTALSAIALELGFADQSHFTRFFKRETGITPRDYLRQLPGSGLAAPARL